MSSTYYDRSYFYGRRKSNYDNYAKTKSIFYDFGKILYREFHPASAFDAGGAFGYLVHGLRRRGVESWGIDISPYAVRHSPFMQLGDITKLKPGRTYDLVTCTDVLEHIPEELVEQTLDGLYLLAGKYLVLVIALAEHSADDLDRTHVCIKPYAWWEELFRRLGYHRCAESEQRLRKSRLCRKNMWSEKLFVLEKGT